LSGDYAYVSFKNWNLFGVKQKIFKDLSRFLGGSFQNFSRACPLFLCESVPQELSPQTLINTLVGSFFFSDVASDSPDSVDDDDDDTLW